VSRGGRIRARFCDPAGARYGIPTYWWKGAPDGLATRRQLRAAGLRPGGQDPAAQLRWMRGRRELIAYLYRIDHAAPVRPMTPAKEAALTKALRARRTCTTCGQVRYYVIPRSLGECIDCAYSLDTAAGTNGGLDPATAVAFAATTKAW
jgi:hypothetical protein